MKLTVVIVLLNSLLYLNGLKNRIQVNIEGLSKIVIVQKIKL